MQRGRRRAAGAGRRRRGPSRARTVRAGGRRLDHQDRPWRRPGRARRRVARADIEVRRLLAQNRCRRFDPRRPLPECHRAGAARGPRARRRRARRPFSVSRAKRRRVLLPADQEARARDKNCDRRRVRNAHPVAVSPNGRVTRPARLRRLSRRRRNGLHRHPWPIPVKSGHRQLLFGGSRLDPAAGLSRPGDAGTEFDRRRCATQRRRWRPAMPNAPPPRSKSRWCGSKCADPIFCAISKRRPKRPACRSSTAASPCSTGCSPTRTASMSAA